MGKATRWLRGFLGMKNVDKKSNLAQKKRWSFVNSGKESGPSSRIPSDASDWMRSHLADTEKEQSKHAIAVAAATAAAADAAVAAADAAVAAAHAAVAVVRLTSQGSIGGSWFAGGREGFAAAKIQCVFRGYLARKALRALKGLVKLQAIVRGFLVRKRAAATLHSMQALIRAQTVIRSQRARRSMSSHPEMRTRISVDRFEENRSEFHSRRGSSSYDNSLVAFDEIPKTVEIDTCRPRSRSRRMSTCLTEYSDDHQYYQVGSSPLPCPINNFLCARDTDCRFVDEDYKFATAQNTPRFGNSGRAHATPAKSVCGESFFRAYSNCPSYMANTQSFNAKLRSHSAPKQRPGLGMKKRLSLDDLSESRASFSGVRMQRSCSQAEVDLES